MAAGSSTTHDGVMLAAAILRELVAVAPIAAAMLSG
jgi:hypothetical protein